MSITGVEVMPTSGRINGHCTMSSDASSIVDRSVAGSNVTESVAENLEGLYGKRRE